MKTLLAKKYRSSKWLVVALILLLFPFACLRSQALGFIRGVHYWGNAWPINFWNGLERSRVDADFERIRQDGFNAIVLAVPWGEFQPSIMPEVFDEERFRLLGWLVQKAGSHGLDVILRVGYACDFAPGVQFRAPERFLMLHTSREARKAWLDFLSRTWQTVGKAPNFLFGFITWEDFWGSMSLMARPLEERRDLASKTGFQDFLKGHYSMDKISSIYGRKFNCWKDIPLPARQSRASRLFYEYWDDFLVNTIFKGARSVFKRLSLEVRVDGDPVPKGNGRHWWYYHDRQFHLPGADTVTVYYSPAWGSKNQGDFIHAARAIELLKRFVGRLESKAGERSIFIDQFNFYDNTPYAAQNIKIMPEELGTFITDSCPILGRYCNGYALWLYRDYEGSVLFNPSFEEGLKGWRAIGTVNIGTDKGGDHFVRLGANSTLCQDVPARRTTEEHTILFRWNDQGSFRYIP